MKRIELGDTLPSGDTVSLELLEKILALPREDENYMVVGAQHEWRVLGAWMEGGPYWESTSNKRTEQTHYGFPKYGRSMYCVVTGKRRNMQINEFYAG